MKTFSLLSQGLGFWLIASLPAYAQFTGASPYRHEGGGLLLNEISNGPTGGVSEYVEFVVTGAPDNPTAPVNLAGWIMDDNNFDGPSQGNAPGHLSFGDCYQAVPPGSILVVFNNESPNPALPPSDPFDDNGDGVYIIPHDHPCMDACSSNPNSSNPLFCPCDNPTGQAFGWQSGLRNEGDLLQVRDACETPVQVISWNGVSITPDIAAAPVYIDLNGAQTGRVIRLMNIIGTNWNDPANYDNPTVGGNESPGAPNSPSNAAFVASLADGSFFTSGLIWDCRDTDAGDLLLPADAPNPLPPLEICQGEDLGAFGVSYALPDEQEPDADGFAFEYAWLLTVDDAPQYTIFTFSLTGDFDFSILPPGTYFIWGISYIQTNGSVSVSEFLDTEVNSIAGILVYTACGFHADVDNLDPNGIPVQVTVLPAPTATPPPGVVAACSTAGTQVVFDLLSYNPDINGNSGLPVSWYTDAAGTMPIANPENFQTGATTVYAQVSNGACLSDMVAVPLVVYPGFEATLNVVQEISCFQSQNGALELDLSGGTAPFVLDWDNNAYDGLTQLSDLGPDNYSVTITDDNGCTESLNIDLAEPTLLEISCGQQSPVSVTGASDGIGQVEATGGTPPYALAWIGTQSGSLTFSGQTSIPGLSAGAYTLTLTDANGCQTQCAFAIQEPGCDLSISLDSQSPECFNSFDGNIEATVNGGLDPVQWSWNTGQSAPVLTGLGPGSYFVTATDAAGCIAVGSAVLTAPPAIQAEVVGLPPLCFGQDNGGMIIQAVSGGTGPYEWSLDGQQFRAIETLPDTVGRLSAGIYPLFIQDQNGCVLEVEITVPEADSLTLELGPDQVVALGETTQISPLLNFEPDSLLWAPINGLEDIAALNQIITPIGDIAYQLTAWDANGCPITDRVTILVDRSRRVYIPNVFSPDFDGINDVFTIYGDNDVVQIQRLLVFDRWGELVYESGPFAPNDEKIGWDGVFRGRKLNPGVYAYLAEILFLDGDSDVFEGSVTLLR